MDSQNKRKSETEKTSEKKVKYNIWNKKETPLTPPTTPNTSKKYDFNIWNQSEEIKETKPIKISELLIGSCMNRPLRFRVSYKSEKRGSKSGYMFVFHATDGSEEIQVTVFAQQTKIFFDMIEKDSKLINNKSLKYNKTYEMKNFNVKKASNDFPVLVGKGFYIGSMGSSIIKEIDNDGVAELQFNFSKIDDIKSMDSNSKCDLVAIIAHNWGQECVGDNKLKRELSLTDESKECIMLTLWGENYNTFEHERSCVLLHNAVVKEFNGTKALTCAKNSLIVHKPNMENATNLKTWFDEEIKKIN